ncbi:hypothetical protein H206_06169 [Candidatus Electrothrix aarhusensis]|uniref:Uncharacterized protein n=1 Tax=Candidatus Electrothrix aarhusensis TaxID=1859131 RepID=A0A444J3N1_9BACT|nr:hypothetical protein H206_06169 [Candidatus Electrothrix aarhusensis]
MLRPLINKNDKLYIISLKESYIGFGLNDVNDWLEKNIPYLI